MREPLCEGAGIFCMLCCPTSSSLVATPRGPQVHLPLLPFHNAIHRMVHDSYCCSLQTSTPHITVQLRLLYCSLISHSRCLQVHGFFGNPIRMFGQLCFLYVGTLGAGLLWSPVLHFNLSDTLGISLTFSI